MIDWKPLLIGWSQDLMKTELAARIRSVARIHQNWLGFHLRPCRGGEIETLEQRLGVTLPESYKAFLLTTNGWRRPTAFINRLRPTQDVNWFRVENEQWVEVYSESGSTLPDEEYYKYGKDGASDHRAEHMFSLLQISDVEDGVYLLNPEAVTPDGEWEAWFFANWIPERTALPPALRAQWFGNTSHSRTWRRSRGLKQGYQG